MQRCFTKVGALNRKRLRDFFFLKDFFGKTVKNLLAFIRDLEYNITIK